MIVHNFRWCKGSNWRMRKGSKYGFMSAVFWRVKYEPKLNAIFCIWQWITTSLDPWQVWKHTLKVMVSIFIPFFPKCAAQMASLTEWVDSPCLTIWQPEKMSVHFFFVVSNFCPVFILRRLSHVLPWHASSFVSVFGIVSLITIGFCCRSCRCNDFVSVCLILLTI